MNYATKEIPSTFMTGVTPVCSSLAIFLRSRASVFLKDSSSWNKVDVGSVAKRTGDGTHDQRTGPEASDYRPDYASIYKFSASGRARGLNQPHSATPKGQIIRG